MTREVVAIHRGHCLALFDDDSQAPFSMMLDGGGDETDDIEQALIAIAPDAEGGWHVLDLAAFEPVMTN